MPSYILVTRPAFEVKHFTRTYLSWPCPIIIDDGCARMDFGPTMPEVCCVTTIRSPRSCIVLQACDEGWTREQVAASNGLGNQRLSLTLRTRLISEFRNPLRAL